MQDPDMDSQYKPQAAGVSQTSWVSLLRDPGLFVFTVSNFYIIVQD